MKYTTLILSITILILFIMCIVLLYYYTTAQATLIDPNTCSKSITDFGVISSVLGNTVIEKCGINMDQPCTFYNITNLEQAIDKCRQNATFCSAFSYSQPNNNSQNGIMSIINYNTGVTQSSIFDTYVQQINNIIS
jgi:hypothetical protein